MIHSMFLMIFLGLWTVLNWTIELWTWLNAEPMDIPENATRKEKRRFVMYKLKFNINSFKWFTLDLVVTMGSISLFMFGESIIAGMMGMLFSNLLSILIIYKMRKMKKCYENGIPKNYTAFNNWKAANA